MYSNPCNQFTVQHPMPAVSTPIFTVVLEFKSVAITVLERSLVT
jgi:hypothetical protein